MVVNLNNEQQETMQVRLQRPKPHFHNWEYSSGSGYIYTTRDLFRKLRVRLNLYSEH